MRTNRFFFTKCNDPKRTYLTIPNQLKIRTNAQSPTMVFYFYSFKYRCFLINNDHYQLLGLNIN